MISILRCAEGQLPGPIEKEAKGPKIGIENLLHKGGLLRGVVEKLKANSIKGKKILYSFRLGRSFKELS